MSSPAKILIVRLSSLGDIILSTPLIRSLKKKYPEAEIDFLLREEYSDTLLLNPYIHKLIRFTNRLSDEIRAQIRREKYDLIIDLQNNLRSAGIIDGASGKKIVYRKRNLSKLLLVRFKWNLLRNAPPVPERYAAGLKNFNLDGEGTELFTNKKPSDNFNLTEQYIGIAPGARHYTKKWLPEYYIETGKRLTEAGYKLVLFGGRDDQDTCRSVSEAIPGSVDLSNNNDLLQTSADMRACKAVICNDSGLMHTAAASGVPVIAIFGSTVKEFGFAPYKTRYRIVEHLSLPCRPCTHIGRKSCPKGHFKCMKEITPVSVHENLLALMNS